MVTSITRGYFTKSQKKEYQDFLLENPTDLQQIEYIRNKFENLRIAQNFQIFYSRQSQFKVRIQNLLIQIRDRNNRNILSTVRTQGAATNQVTNQVLNHGGNPAGVPEGA